MAKVKFAFEGVADAKRRWHAAIYYAESKPGAQVVVTAEMFRGASAVSDMYQFDVTVGPESQGWGVRRG